MVHRLNCAVHKPVKCKCWSRHASARFRRGHPRPKIFSKTVVSRLVAWSRWIVYTLSGLDAVTPQIVAELHDRMTESTFLSVDAAAALFSHAEPKPLQSVDILGQGKDALIKANRECGLPCRWMKLSI